MTRRSPNEHSEHRQALHSEQLDRRSPGAQSLRLITRSVLLAIVPYTPQHILRLEKRGLFPRRVQVGANRVAWLLSEIEAWIALRVSERDKANS